MAKAKTMKNSEKKSDAAAPRAEKATKKAKAAAAKQAKGEKEQVKVDREQLIRLQADFENFKKRTIRERNETYRRANEDIMEELLPVMDHLELALDAATQHDADEAIGEGFRLVSEQLRAALAKFGLTPIDATDAEFDHNLHEAISHLPSPDVAENHVIAMTRRGYKLGDRLLRAAQVVVSSGDPAAAVEIEVDVVDEEAPEKEAEA
ncbi:MAG: nucleotide exchange factor GrpE [Kiritimatiellia bacterium]|jgi:molecular chaperone GrpE|nr:nucleotide exchange factor GrpE [Kiritimatiellia bacterium]MDP6631018.1 nucleotide exchange factor GrpE [Kiritimatiellia bacterium]MDP6809974.1 nucleotide exchange factor GrpE [Kiritimatiellia bacterium]MDP7024745.1 nucleotide exchange factor GrpE [Kiritimatiellia bacterium]